MLSLISRCSVEHPAPRFILVLLLLGTLLPSSEVQAHFKLNLNIRIIHIEHLENGLNVYIRLPMPYLVANQLGPERADGTREAAPFTLNTMVGGELMHYLDIDALARGARPLGQMVADGHTLRRAGRELPLQLAVTRVYDGNSQPPFSTLQEAQSAFTDAYQLPAAQQAPFVGDSVVDVLLQLRGSGVVDAYTISSSLNPGLPLQDETANLILDHRQGEQRIFRLTGLLAEPHTVGSARWQAAKTFVIEGIRHILGGYDHVLYVVCLVIAALTLAGLAWRITGFTIGHSITLSLGYLGFVPSGVWFVLLVETGIALSIIYAAVAALSIKPTANQMARQAYASGLITLAIGLLHGLGFSFLLKDMLGSGSASIWTSLLSFNIGVEIGQLAIVLLIWPVLLLLNRINPLWLQATRWLLAVPALTIASMWTGQRAMQLFAELMA